MKMFAAGPAPPAVVNTSGVSAYLCRCYGCCLRTNDSDSLARVSGTCMIHLWQCAVTIRTIAGAEYPRVKKFSFVPLFDKISPALMWTRASCAVLAEAGAPYH